MNSKQSNQVDKKSIIPCTKHVHNKLTINPLIYDEPEITLATVSHIMDYLLVSAKPSTFYTIKSK